ncbi:hypothetical protein [Chondromyces crocatus]|uniref:Uncharacterized protein n=1 Tax=Chondromyces crocatus TaxID=52 RepID=A0A0K1ETC0_CHOCO|nr:hypothetical protein [Chondromyces crocatus]AKT44165.1 uncharacterized protein CMC5_084050 [Chondromyces crocatus]
MKMKSFTLVALLLGGSLFSLGCSANLQDTGTEGALKAVEAADEQAADEQAADEQAADEQAADEQAADEQAAHAATRGEPITTCGGFTGQPCGGTNECVDDPSDDCDPQNGGSDCGGICVGAMCGGFAGIPCSRDHVCLDDPRDDCDPENGGADCPGTCIFAGDPE